ncbi:hypothetical protein [Listeria grayi]|uniref:Uncharacterized protein n=1 Tax=Listeria grayi FSL F6-1183 TaxID=1265827 RepID=A0A829R746_LISGR|nr:hypothetical protein [Listeria grayi]EUJ27864.1 hypothetical protein LMUR_10154 [Listeria grayi FSL F6-1183]
MMALVNNEWRKLMARKSSWILQLILIVFIIGSAILLLSLSNMLGNSAEDGVTTSENGVIVYQSSDGSTISEEQYQSLSDSKSSAYKEKTLSPKDSVTELKKTKKRLFLVKKSAKHFKKRSIIIKDMRMQAKRLMFLAVTEVLLSSLT